MNASVVPSQRSSSRRHEPSKDEFFSCAVLEESASAGPSDRSSLDEFYSCDYESDEHLGETDEPETFSMPTGDVARAKRRRDDMRRKLEDERRRGRQLQARIETALEELRMFERLVEIKKANDKKKTPPKLAEPRNSEEQRGRIPPRRLAFCYSARGSEAKQSIELEPTTAHHKIRKVNPYVGSYVLGDFLGKGGFGSVFVGRHYQTREKFAVKMIDKDETGKSRRRMMAVEREAYVLKSLHHPNIIRLREIVHSPTHICLIMELGHTDLWTWAETNGIDSRVCREIMLGIIKPIQYLHSHGVAHLDIKEDNILVTKRGPFEKLTQRHIKLCDFGLCTISSEAGGPVERKGLVGTTGYFAPEMAKEKNYDACSADMFSVGCTLLHLLGKGPEGWNRAYRKCQDQSTFFRHRIRGLATILRCDDSYFEKVAFPAVQVIRGLLVCNPKKRLTAGQALNWLGA